MSPGTKEVVDRDGQPIHVGEKVWSHLRGGRQEGVVEAVLLSQEDIHNVGDIGVVIKHPPKVIFTDQHGHKVSHNPDALMHAEAEQE
ncbi:hypothetical protein EWM64_g5420 [Hericium alpestre]|uniref:Hypervirulence associated protein TUDOR domain-containing protein n=1 Tax=Hericium alpestre TaxID=135208 RepID=A0A4Y9ZX19_9AGAM|nr:hypothetical protein EWM64_g5420 [Hericium alpestre]